MTKSASWILVLGVFLASLTACSIPRQSPASQERFDFILHDTLTTSDIAHLANALDANYDRVLKALDVDSLPTITVQVWSDEEQYQVVMEEAFGSRFPGSRGYVTGDSELRLLYHRRLSAQKEAVHEFAHVVSLNLNPNFGNNPRWLWEAVALYLADELRNPADVEYMRSRDFPTLEALNAGFNSNKNIYDVGYLLVDYIVSNWGQDALINLIHSNGDIPITLNIEVIDFESGWHQFLEDKYLSP